MQVALFFAGLLLTNNCLAAAPKVVHKITDINTAVIDTETGKRKGLDWTPAEIEQNAFSIFDVSFSADSENTIILKGELQNANTKISTSFSIQFSAYDSARVFKDLLVNTNQNFLFARSQHSRSNETPARELLVWNAESAGLIPVGELVGPRRSYDDQNWFTKALIHIYGQSYLNKISLEKSVSKSETAHDL